MDGSAVLMNTNDGRFLTDYRVGTVRRRLWVACVVSNFLHLWGRRKLKNFGLSSAESRAVEEIRSRLQSQVVNGNITHLCCPEENANGVIRKRFV